ncbi:Secreted subtilisin-like serine protease sub4 [Orbilia javanica]|uniref:Cuticle-degrading serine protease n=1 Tax=Orbilia javanica TaxID=47235 RepID=A0AAN8NEQ1_9PEZI
MLNLIPTLLTVASIATSALAAPAALKVLNSDVAGAIPDQYIVVFKTGITDSATDAHTRRISSFHSSIEARDPKGRKGRRTRGVQKKINVSGKSKFRGYTGEFDKETLQEILKSPEVDFVEQDAVVKLDFGRAHTPKIEADEPELQKRVYRSKSTWGLDRISHVNFKKDKRPDEFRYYYNDAWSGEGATVYVIDTGVYWDHDELRDMKAVDYSRVRWGTNTISKDLIDGNGHGTHCAGTIGGLTYGVARRVNLVAVKVLDNDGSGTWSSVLAGMNWVAADAKANTSVVSMSLGGGKLESVNQAVKALYDRGVTVIVAAGNEADDASKYSPASADNAITVGALDVDGTVPDFSNYGSAVDILAPGVNVLSSVIGSDTATDYYSGTSMATPHVAGLAAYFISKSLKETGKGIAPGDMKKILLDNAWTVTRSSLGQPTKRTLPTKIAGNNYCNTDYTGCDVNAIKQ